MAVPVISSAELNKTTFQPGETMVLTVVGYDPDEQQLNVTISVENPDTGAMSGPVTVGITLDQLATVATDPSGREWRQTGHAANTYTLTATA